MSRGIYFRTEEYRKNLGKAISKALTGKKLSEKHKNNIRLALIGKPSGRVGKKLSKEHKEKFSRKGKFVSNKTKQKLREKRIKYLETHKIKYQFKNTSIEKRIEKYLDKLVKFKIISNYIKQFNIKRWVVDFYIPELNLIIECYGTYWHKQFARKYKDMLRQKALEKMNYRILILWDKEIELKDFDLEKLLNKIGELKC